MVKVGQRYSYVDGRGPSGKVSFVAEVVTVSPSDARFGDCKIVQIVNWPGVAIGHIYRGNDLTGTNYWILLEGQESPEA